MTSADIDLEKQLAASRIEPYDRLPPRCDECWDDAEPAWQCRRCQQVFYGACADEHAQPPACDAKADA